ncbi:3-phenylpropionate/trans-cinnamate dioxygenase ferredoxin reductase subunit [Polaromonas sp. OV174]|uniref:NAD(P)/FAD-dependent oxidoreductase n=1 Tax=Polaromonas sp. OV174 TaxID=1855300 RepID=UPI0008F00FB7|nr:FAD-dependent oxidoreductase [Polaromonas sp. OV174]SFB89507.1 3-phenylpropionate/trans-cinnamate dioxygenase ferredoxin reductase subunit [Polaromonas sp. OV174]
MKSVVIAGAGQAAAWVARTLRSEGFAGQLVMCGAESVPPYERPPLSKEQLVPGAADMAYLIRPEEFSALGVEWRAATHVERIDRAARAVELSSGEWLKYDALVIATGGRAHIPPIPGFDRDCVHTLRTLDDARRLRDRLLPGRRVLVVGGGWIGLEVAAAAVRRGAAVTLVEMGSNLCARSGVQDLSTYLHDLHVSNGVQVRLNTRVVRLDTHAEGSYTAEFDDGSSYVADVVVVGAGLVPNSDMAIQAGLDCDRGILVDATGRSSDPCIFAAGDVAVLRTADGRGERLESWQNAQDQGIAVAQSLMGKPTRYEPLPFFWSTQYDELIQMTGTAHGVAEWLMRPGGSGTQQTHLGLNGSGKVVFGLCINAPRDIRVLRRSIAEAASLDRSRFADSAVPLARAVVAAAG